jgi:hypothetical protein
MDEDDNDEDDANNVDEEGKSRKKDSACALVKRTRR